MLDERLLDEPLAGLAEADRVVVADLIKRLSENIAKLAADHALQAKFLGVVQDEESNSFAREAIA